MVSADGSSQSFGGLTAQMGWFGLRVGGHPALSLHSSNEPSELSQWLWHHDSTINIVSNIIIIIIIIIAAIFTAFLYKCSERRKAGSRSNHYDRQRRVCWKTEVWVAADEYRTRFTNDKALLKKSRSDTSTTSTVGWITNYSYCHTDPARVLHKHVIISTTELPFYQEQNDHPWTEYTHTLFLLPRPWPTVWNSLPDHLSDPAVDSEQFNLI